MISINPIVRLYSFHRHVAPKTATVRTVLEGGELRTMVWEQVRPRTMSGNLKIQLSEAQLAVLRLVNRGLSNQQIAEALAITVGTTKWHLHRIYVRLQVSNRTAAAAKARELGLL